MIRKALAMLSLCLIVLCAFIGVLSHNEMQKSDKRDEAALSVSCESLIDSPPEITQSVTLTDFAPGKFRADFDFDEDGVWDALCLPLFPNKKIDVSRHYRSVLVCFRGVDNQEELEELLENQALEVTFWPERQKLDDAVHSSIAQQYMRLDFKHSPVLLYGFEKSNPVLGATTLQFSKYGGGGAGVIFILALLSLLFKSKPTEDELVDPRKNLAGLPTSNLITSGLIDS